MTRHTSKHAGFNGNMTDGAGRTTTWTSFNMPGQVTSQTPNGARTAAFWYNPEHERTKELQADQSIVITLSPRYDTGLHFEKKYIAAGGALTGAVEYEHYLYAGGLMFGKYVTITQTDGQTIASTRTDYYSKDNLGSIVAITDQTGAVTQRLSYDPWGKRRYPNGAADPNGLLNNPDMYHGYSLVNVKSQQASNFLLNNKPGLVPGLLFVGFGFDLLGLWQHGLMRRRFTYAASDV